MTGVRLQRALRRLPLERALQLALATTVFSFALGSTKVIPLLVIGRPLRWVALATLAVVAVGAAAARMRRPRLLAAPPFLLAAALVGLAFASALWSVRPSLTLARATTVAVLFGTVAALALATVDRPASIRRMLLGVLAGAAAVAVSGLILLVVEPDLAVEPVTAQYPARFNGIGENPNTTAMLLALGLPLALWLLIEARSRLARGAAVALSLLFLGSIVASGSRGALLAGFAGSLVLVLSLPSKWRRRLALGIAVLAVFALAVALTQIPQPEAAPPATGRDIPSAPTGRHAELALPLEEEIGGERTTVYRRSLFTSSGRFKAWRGAFDQALQRPLLGYGFGTEDRVFVDRFYLFYAVRPENSYIGAFLQLGLVGLGLLSALVLVLLATALRARPEPLLAACTAVFVSGLVLALTQSYLWSVGNIATASLWVCAFLIVAAGRMDEVTG